MAGKLSKLEREMRQADSYEHWKQFAKEHDAITGLKRWREVDQTSQYDYAQIRRRLDRLRSLRARHDDTSLLFTLNEGIHGNMGGMGRNSLHLKAKYGSKKLIEDYVDEIDDSLRYLAELDSPDISRMEKLDFYYRANHCYGRSALMLSGGGVLGFYHLGVVKALLEQDLLPRVISGSSAGALIAGVLGTHTGEELHKFYDPKHLRSEAQKEAGVFDRMLFGRHPQVDVQDLNEHIARLIPDLTFQEAYEKTGRQISITVAPAEPHQSSRLLNAIASPNVYIRSAVMASCAVPGVYPPVILTAKNVHGDSQAYLPTRRWVDGSIADDLPAKRLGRLYSTNHYIVSMVNPIATPFLRSGTQNRLISSLTGLGIGLSLEVLNFYRGIAQRMGDKYPRTNMLLNSIHSLLDQDYSGDINIVPDFRFYDPRKLLSHLTENDLVALIDAGERSAWQQIKAIRTCTRISRTLDEILDRFERGDLRARPKPARKKRLKAA